MTPFQELAALNYVRVTTDNLQNTVRRQNQELELIRATLEKNNAAARIQAEDEVNEEADRITARAFLCDLETLLKGIGDESPASRWRNVALAINLLHFTDALGKFESLDDLRFHKHLESTVNKWVPIAEAEMGVAPHLLDECSAVDTALQEVYAIWSKRQVFLISPEDIDKRHEELCKFDHPLTRAPFIPDFNQHSIDYNQLAGALLMATELKTSMDEDLDAIRQGISPLLLSDDGNEIASEVYLNTEVMNLRFQAMARGPVLGIRRPPESTTITKQWTFLASRDLREFLFKSGQLYESTVENLSWVTAELRALDQIFRQDNAYLEEVNTLTAEGNYRTAREKLALCSGRFSNFKLKDFEDAIGNSAFLITDAQVLLNKVDALAKRKKSLIGNLMGSSDQIKEINLELGRLQAALVELPECEIADDLRDALSMATNILSKEIGLRLAD
jgi:hypothetical protein